MSAEHMTPEQLADVLDIALRAIAVEAAITNPAAQKRLLTVVADVALVSALLPQLSGTADAAVLLERPRSG